MPEKLNLSRDENHKGESHFLSPLLRKRHVNILGRMSVLRSSTIQQEG